MMSRRQQEDELATARKRVTVGYARLLDGDDSHTGLESQRRLIRSEAKRRGLSLTWSCDTSDRRETLDRAGIARSLRLLRTEGHAALIVADLTCLTRALPLLSAIFQRSADEGWSIVSLGPPRLDTALSEGKTLQSVLNSCSALQELDEENPAVNAIEVEPSTRSSPKDRIIWERVTGSSLGQIANGLNRDRIPAPGKGEGWLPSAVWAELESLRPGSR